jgi:hypothetical protein
MKTTSSKPREYAVWVKVDKTLPWIELDGTYDTLPDAWRAVERFKKNLKLKVVESPKLLEEKGVVAVPRVSRSAARKRR